MITSTPDNSLKVCNALLMGNERRDMVSAAHFSAAEQEANAERIRERLGYGASDCRIDMDKTGSLR